MVNKFVNYVQPLSKKIFKSRVRQIYSLIETWKEEDKENELSNKTETPDQPVEETSLVNAGKSELKNTNEKAGMKKKNGKKCKRIEDNETEFVK